MIALTAGIGLLAVLAPGSALLPTLYLTASMLHGVRLARWHGWKTLRVPLLWSMHLSYLCIPLAMLGLALANGDPAAEKNLIHLLGVGANRRHDHRHDGSRITGPHGQTAGCARLSQRSLCPGAARGTGSSAGTAVGSGTEHAGVAHFRAVLGDRIRTVVTALPAYIDAPPGRRKTGLIRLREQRNDEY